MLRDAIVAGLDNWLLLSLRHNDPAHVWLTAVLQAADTDEWRARVRRARR